MELLFGVGFIIGAALGSFSKAAADRVIAGKTIKGRSYCLACKHQLKWYDLFPVLSYLLLKGRCRNCKKPIPKENFISEIMMGIAGGLILITTAYSSTLWQNPEYWPLALVIFNVIYKLFIAVVLLIIFWTDLKTGLIFDRITYPAVAVGSSALVILTALRSWVFYQELTVNPVGRFLLPPYTDYLQRHLLILWQGVLWSFLSGFLAAGFFILLIILTKGKGMGWGDVKLVLFMGIVLGFPNILVALIFAFLSGAIFSLGLIALGKKGLKQTIAFGPFLSLGGFIALVWGAQLFNWYVGRF